MLGILMSQNRELNLDAEFSEVGNFDAGTVNNLFQQAARVNLDVLIIDLDCAPVSSILDGLHYFRIHRPNTRIIVLAVGRKLGDILLASIVAKGVYDILIPDVDDDIQLIINKVLASPPSTYAHAARFIQDLEQQQQKQQDVILQQRPLGLTVIAVAGAGSGAGATHISLAIAGHIGKAGNKVLIAEYPTAKERQGKEENRQGKKSQYYFYAQLKDGVIRDGVMHTKFFDILTASRERNVKGVRYIFEAATMGKYDYLVFDLGNLSAENIEEMDRASVGILVASAAPYRYEYMLPVLAEDDITFMAHNIKNWKLVLNLASDSYTKWFKNAFGKYLGDIYPLPYFTDPLLDAPTDLVQEIVNSVMPVIKVEEKKSFINKLFNRDIKNFL